nr:cytochrome B6-f complex subunit [Rhodaphanes brevistipitata]UNJ18404.1 cytochrome B6-f complex subunit [Rhodaphanes brevistipitata]
MGKEIITTAEISFVVTIVGLVIGFVLLKLQGD